MISIYQEKIYVNIVILGMINQNFGMIIRGSPQVLTKVPVDDLILSWMKIGSYWTLDFGCRRQSQMIDIGFDPWGVLIDVKN